MVIEATLRRGRPRDPALDEVILGSARRILAKRGFTGTTMDEIARTAGVGKDTLYRRWKSKEALVKDLLSGLAAEQVPVPALDEPRYALFAFLQDIVRLNKDSDFGTLVAGIVGESARNPELAVGFRQFWAERRQLAADLVRRIVPVSDVDRILDHLLGPIYYRLLLSGASIDDEYLWGLVMEVPWPASQSPIQPRN